MAQSLLSQGGVKRLSPALHLQKAAHHWTADAFHWPNGIGQPSMGGCGMILLGFFSDMPLGLPWCRDLTRLWCQLIQAEWLGDFDPPYDIVITLAGARRKREDSHLARTDLASLWLFFITAVEGLSW